MTEQMKSDVDLLVEAYKAEGKRYMLAKFGDIKPKQKL